MSHLTFTFGEKASEKPQKPRKGKTQGKLQGNAKKGAGAIYGIPMAIINAQAKPGESESDAALRLLDEARRRKT